MKVEYIVSGRGVVNMFTQDGDRLPPINTDHPNYHEIVGLLSKTKGDVDVDALFALVDVQKAILDYSDGRITVKDNTVYVNDQKIPGELAQRMLQMMSDGYTLDPFIKFCENLMGNPSMSSVNQLFTFLEHVGLPITEDGHFLAYKGVTKDYKDKWTKKISNHIGAVIEMPRNQVLDDPQAACGKGLHAGALEYANGWAGEDGILVLVKVNPRDAVSVPSDCSFQKLRTCRYEVIADHDDRSLLPSSLVTCDGVTADPSRFVPKGYEPVNSNPASAHFTDGEHEIVPGKGERVGGVTFMTADGPVTHSPHGEHCHYCDNDEEHCECYEEDDMDSTCYECGYPDDECHCCYWCCRYPCECGDYETF